MSRPRSPHKDVARLLRAAERHGCHVTRTRSGHWRIRSRAGVVIIAGTPSDRRALHNARASLARLGVIL